MAKFLDNEILELKEFPHYPNEIGMIIDYLTIEYEIDYIKEYPIYYICKCKCGKEVIRGRKNLMYVSSFKSCGCYLKEFNIKTKTIHGGAKHKNGKQDRLYKIWRNMFTRCNDPNHKSYEDYGARGITVCKDWEDFKVFKKWAKSSGYKKNLTIERIDVNKGYSPDNCIWIPKVDQSKNTRHNSYFIINGEKYLQIDLAKKFGVSGQTINSWALKGKLQYDYWSKENR